MGGASSIGGEDVRPSRDVQSLLIPKSHSFNSREYANSCLVFIGAVLIIYSFYRGICHSFGLLNSILLL